MSNTIEKWQFQALQDCFHDGGSVRQAMRAARVAKHTALRYQRLYKHALPPVLPQTKSNGSEVGYLCRYMPQRKRIQLWEAKEGPVPEGKRVGWLCNVPYCDNVEHMCLAENKNFGKQHVVAHNRQRLHNLEVGEAVELSRPANMNSFRSTIAGFAGNNCYAIRTSADGHGVRIFRTGNWREREDALMVSASLPVVWIPPRAQRPISIRRPACIYFGFIGGSCGSCMHASEAARRTRPCSVRGCPFPRNGGAMCHRHEHFFEYQWSMEWRGIDSADLYGNEKTMHPLFTTLKGWEINASAWRTVFEHAGMRNPGWKISDDWWRENVQKYDNQQQAISNWQTTGGIGRKGWGKKKIRKAQRRRGPGWHGPHPDHDPVARFTRDTLRETLPQLSPHDESPDLEPEEELSDDYTSLAESEEWFDLIEDGVYSD